MDLDENRVEVTVLATCDLTPTVREFLLRYPRPVRADPGAHVDVAVTIDGRADTRSYSVVEASGSDTVSIAVKRVQDSRGGSRHMWSLAAGARLKATLPRTDFVLSTRAPYYLLLAGGIGITPLVGMARLLAYRGKAFKLVYAARDATEFAYGERLRASLQERLVLLDGSRGESIDAAAEIAALPDDAELYLCGPVGLMEAVRAAWADQGRMPSRLRFESFGASGHRANRAFTVSIPRLGREVDVPAGRSLLAALNDAGVATLSNCKRGECGLCALDVIGCDGEIDHRDVFLDAAEKAAGRRICACVSRVAGGRIVLEPAWRGDPDLAMPELAVR